ncbi:MAG: pyridoxal phosphate-dependent aminotransferase [Chitinophagaceae bacterium]|nr:pyridoxal phosphate-dependent aminotransferase [Chitinophagaceae bacterium]
MNDVNPFQHEINLNLNIRSLKPSATLLINERSNALVQQGSKVYKLGLGQSPFPVPDPVVRALQENAFQKDYLPVKGLPALRDAICGFYERHSGVRHDPEYTIIGPGSKELLFLLQLVYYGELVIPTPSWVSYAPQAKIIGRNIHWVPTQKENKWLLMPEELEKLCAEDPTCPRLLILNYPNNPTGYTYSRNELMEIAKVARKYKVIVVADEIYGLLHHHQEHHSIAPFYPEGTILSGGLSKWCGAGGWRLGTFSFPRALDWLANSIAVAASETFTSTSAPIQYAAVSAFLPNPEIDDYLQRASSILRELGAFCNAILNSTGIDNPAPEGGFYLFPDFSMFIPGLSAKGIYSSRQLAEALLEEKAIALLPGSEFGRSEKEMTLRLSYVNFDGKTAMEAAKTETVNRLFIEKYCSDTIESMWELKEWFLKL